jgi:hypothetical protein
MSINGVPAIAVDTSAISSSGNASDGGIGAGGIAAIVIVLLVVIAIALVGAFVWRRRRASRSPFAAKASTDSDVSDAVRARVCVSIAKRQCARTQLDIALPDIVLPVMSSPTVPALPTHAHHHHAPAAAPHAHHHLERHDHQEHHHPSVPYRPLDTKAAVEGSPKHHHHHDPVSCCVVHYRCQCDAFAQKPLPAVPPKKDDVCRAWRV